MNAPGKTMLKVVSILYIVCGGFFALLMIISLFAGSAIAEVFAGYLGGYVGIAGAAIAIALVIVFLLLAAADLVFGIVGLKQCGNPSASLFFIIVGFILGGLVLIGMLRSFNIGSLISLVMPTLFVIGGFMNKNAQQIPPQYPPQAPPQV